MAKIFSNYDKDWLSAEEWQDNYYGYYGEDEYEEEDEDESDYEGELFY